MNDRLAYCVYQGGKLQFINIFYPPSPDQVSEAIEHVHRTLQLDPSELRLFLTGRSPHRAQAQSYLQETAGALIMNPADFFPAQPALQEAGIQLHEYSYLYIPEA
jgi:hypothetical protein